jgi:hypothetical protein
MFGDPKSFVGRGFSHDITVGAQRPPLAAPFPRAFMPFNYRAA